MFVCDVDVSRIEVVVVFELSGCHWCVGDDDPYFDAVWCGLWTCLKCMLSVVFWLWLRIVWCS